MQHVESCSVLAEIQCLHVIVNNCQIVASLQGIFLDSSSKEILKQNQTASGTFISVSPQNYIEYTIDLLAPGNMWLSLEYNVRLEVAFNLSLSLSLPAVVIP